MSDREQVLDLLDDGPLTTDEVADQSGLERRQAAMLLQQLAKDGLARSGRGGWRRVADDGSRTPPRASPAVLVHHQPSEPDAAPAMTRRTSKRSGVKSAPAVVGATIGVDRRARFIFGMSEAGELLVTDAKDTSKTVRFTAFDTTRLHQVLERWKPMLQPLSEAA